MILILIATLISVRAEAAKPCAIQVVDKENGWPVPMVELRTNNQVRFVTDNAGRIAFDLPELMGRETWFNVSSDGYEVPADGFGCRGVQLTPEPGKQFTVEVHRTSIAKRLGRITGAGLFGESQELGLEPDWKETGVLGCDSIQTADHDDRMFWLWGDTTIARYPFGIFDASGATSAIRPMKTFEPPLRLTLDYFTNDAGRPRCVAKMPGAGPTWLSGCVSLPDKVGRRHLVATYAKIKPPLKAYERGLCVWNERTSNFEHLRTIWMTSKAVPKAPLLPQGHAVIVDGNDNRKWVLFGDPLPMLRCPATFEAWQDPSNWEKLSPQESIPSAAGGKPVKPASGAIAWNAFRKRWVSVFLQTFGTPSAFGEIWYAEADSPYGPWGPAVKVLSHKNYTFYNPQLHPEFTPADSPVLLFEGTHSTFLADRPEPTPRYDYNQILYRLDLDDPKLAPARTGRTANGR
ncbi:MAG TPA: hypothetical protein VFW73_06835 [Lacipirellulaceae bacterium]|nr:hypothetical protein [Lacipirellulaceae bacterium]